MVFESTSAMSSASVSIPSEISKKSITKLKHSAQEAEISKKKIADKAKRDNAERSANTDRLIAAANEDMVKLNTRIRFRKHPVNNRAVIQVVDKDSGKLIMEVPSSEAINLSVKMHILTGIMMDKTS